MGGTVSAEVPCNSLCPECTGGHKGLESTLAHPVDHLALRQQRYLMPTSAGKQESDHLTLDTLFGFFYIMPRELAVTFTNRYLRHREGPCSPSPSRVRVTQLHATTAKTLVVKHGTTQINSWPHAGSLSSPKHFVFREYIHLCYLLS